MHWFWIEPSLMSFMHLKKRQGSIIDIWQQKLHHLESSEGEKQHSTTGWFLFLYFFLFPSSEMSLQKQPDQGMLLC